MTFVFGVGVLLVVLGVLTGLARFGRLRNSQPSTRQAFAVFSVVVVIVGLVLIVVGAVV